MEEAGVTESIRCGIQDVLAMPILNLMPKVVADNPYRGVVVEKAECIVHVQKRVNTGINIIMHSTMFA